MVYTIRDILLGIITLCRGGLVAVVEVVVVVVVVLVVVV